MPERIDGGRALAGLGALMLIVSLFLHWFNPLNFGLPAVRAGGGALTAWDAFEFLDLLLTFLALVVIVHSVPAVARAVHAPTEPSGLFPTVGIVALIIVAAALINHPPAASGRSLAFGAWLGFAGAALMAIGGVLSAARVSIVVAVSPRPRRAARPAEPPESRPTEPFDARAESRTRRLRRSPRE
jgi:hypothetical protein